LVTLIADSGDMGRACVGDFVDRPLILNNSGDCPLTVFTVVSDSIEFLVPSVVAYPVVISAGDSLEIPIRFQPTSFGVKAATITVTSDDPSSPHTVTIAGFAPSGTLAVSGSTQFGGVEFGQRVQQVLSVCNVGDCDLHVTRVAFKPLCGCEGEFDESGCNCDEQRPDDGQCDQRCSQFKLLNNPFPATLHPGACLPVVIQFTPRCNPPRCCELVIESDDPATPQKTLFVGGHLRRTLVSAIKCWGAAELQEVLEAGGR
jgi:hypothetical protein